MEAVAEARAGLAVVEHHPAEQGVEEVGRPALELALRQRVQPQSLQASRQGVGERRQNNTWLDPVSRKRPGVRRRSMASFMAAKIAGARCTSSKMTRSGKSATNPMGSAAAAAHRASSSKLT